AQRRVDVGELEADRAAADHQQAARHLPADLQGARRVDEPLAVDLEPGDARRPRARGDDEPLRPVALAGDLDLVLAHEPRLALQELDLVALEELRDAARHLLDDAGLEGLDLSEVELRLAEPDADPIGLAAVPDLGGHVQQGLGRDAADVEAHAPDVPLLGAGDLQAQLRGADGGVVAAGARADDDEVEVHGRSLLCAVPPRSPGGARRSDNVPLPTVASVGGRRSEAETRRSSVRAGGPGSPAGGLRHRPAAPCGPRG